MFRIEKSIEFDAAHRVLNHEGKCAHLHGHRYKVVFVLQSDELDKVGRVVDFGFVKSSWGSWIDRMFDHGVILTDGDPLIQIIHLTDTQTKMYVLPRAATAEGIAMYLFKTFHREDKRLIEVRVWETPNCVGVYTDVSIS